MSSSWPRELVSLCSSFLVVPPDVIEFLQHIVVESVGKAARNRVVPILNFSSSLKVASILDLSGLAHA